jgi:hypothetical protein
MKYCEDYAALLDAYIDNECSGEERARVEAHLASCDGCRAYVQEVRMISDAFPDVEETEVPDGFADGVMAAVRADAAPQKKNAGGWAKLWLPRVACLLVLLGAGYAWGCWGGATPNNAVMTAAAAPENAESTITASSAAGSAADGEKNEALLMAPRSADAENGEVESDTAAGTAGDSGTDATAETAAGDSGTDTTAETAGLPSADVSAAPSEAGQNDAADDGTPWKSEVSPIFRNQPLERREKPDGSTYEERLAKLEELMDAAGSLDFWVEEHIEDGANIAYYGQWMGTPHMDQYGMFLYLSDGTLYSLPLPWSSAMGSAPPEKMWFDGDTFVYEMTFEKDTSTELGLYHVAGTYHYTVDLVKQTISLEIL